MSHDAREDDAEAARERGFDELLAILSAEGAGLADYRPAAVRRGVAVRMARRTAASMAEYLALVHQDPAELGHLLDTLFFRHTRFFRDVEVFEALEERVLPQLTGPTRAWAIGVASGEEAYSIAMLLANDSRVSRRGFEVLGSDVDPRGLEVARRGAYRLQAREDVPERFQRFLLPSARALHVAEPIRGHVAFVEHDLLSPQLAPTSSILASYDIVLCRNLLTYFSDRYRERVMSRLAAIVRPGGALVLGKLEAFLTPDDREFHTFPGTDPALRILRRTAVGHAVGRAAARGPGRGRVEERP